MRASREEANLLWCPRETHVIPLIFSGCVMGHMIGSCDWNLPRAQRRRHHPQLDFELQPRHYSHYFVPSTPQFIHNDPIFSSRVTINDCQPSRWPPLLNTSPHLSATPSRNQAIRRPLPVTRLPAQAPTLVVTALLEPRTTMFPTTSR